MDRDRLTMAAATVLAMALALAVGLGVMHKPPGSQAQPKRTATPAAQATGAVTATTLPTEAAAESRATPEPAAAVTGSAPAPVTATVTANVTSAEALTKSVSVTAGAETSATVAAEQGAAVRRQSLTIHFDDFDAAAELTYPLIGEGPFPTLLLIAGSGIEDMDASICSFGSAEPLSQNFRLIAEELPRHGFAVLRYSKHYVTGPCQADFMQYYSRVDLPLLLQDAGQVLAAAQSNELVDAERLYLYGWSEGSTIAASLAISHSDAIAGLVLQAPVTLSWYDTFLYQFADVQLPFVRELAVDGKIAPESLLELVNGHAGLVAMGGLTYLADPQVMAQNQLALNPYFDRDENGEIDIDAELLPNVRSYLDQLFEPGGPFAIYAAERALRTVNEQAPSLLLPVLILQGAHDANVPAFGAQLLNVLLAGNPDHTLLLYPELGHSLGEAVSTAADNFGPMQPQPLADLAAWLSERASR